MQLLRPIVGLLLVGLLITATKADISLKLRNKPYLSPPLQEVPIEKTFFKYANSRYQIYEVHNHYEPSAANDVNKQKTLVKNNYLPPQQEEIYIQHINAPADFPLDDPNLDASYISFASGSDSNNKQIIVKHETRIASANNKLSNNIQSNNLQSHNVPIPFPSNYQHNFPKKSSTAVEYLPPKQNIQSSRKPGRPRQKIKGHPRHQQQVVKNFNTQQQTQQFAQQHVQYHHTSQEAIPANDGKLSYKGPGYLPPHQIDSAKQNTGFKGPEISISYQQEVTQSPQSSFQQNTGFKGPEISTTHQLAIAQEQQKSYQQNFALKGPDYLPPHQHSSAQHKQTSYHQNSLPSHQDITPQGKQTSFQQNSSFKGPDYLPPHQDDSVKQQPSSFQQISQYKGSDYLPPHKDGSSHPQQTSIQQSSSFRGPHYLPPYTNQVSQQQTQYQETNPNFKVSGYLPPGYDFEKPDNSEQAIAELHTLPEESQQYQQDVTVATQNQVPEREQSFDIIYGTPKQENSQQSGGLYQAPGYLPPDYVAPIPKNSEQAINQLHSQEPPQQNTPQEYMPAGYDYQKPDNSEQAIQQLHREEPSEQIVTSFKASTYLPPDYVAPKPENSDQAIKQLHSLNGDEQQTSRSAAENIGGQSTNIAGYLPPDYVFQKPAEAVNQSYQIQTQQTPYHSSQNPKPIQSFNQVSQQQQQSYTQGPVSQQSQSGALNYKAADSSQSILQHITQPSTTPFKGPDYLPPVSSSPISQAQQQAQLQQIPQPAAQFKAPDYLPPSLAAHTQPIERTIMYPLSSYMTTVQSHERYGNARKPFPEYGPPPTTAATIFNNNDVSPMYREPATRPQYYAPAMSYTNNAINTQTYTTYTQNQYQQSSSVLNQQTRQTLQTFMPKDIRQEIPHNQITDTHTFGAKTTLQTIQSPTAKIRTVQIVKHDHVKTLKVLESLDNAGVKTIKILGHSNENPMGDHRVIKVVSGQGQIEQTVKIFNDQQDANTVVYQSPQSNSNTGYLPPRRKRNSKKSSTNKVRSRI